MKFAFDFYYPSKESPDFIVSSITGGYEFKMKNEETFQIASTVLHSSIMATSYDGEKAEAIEIFRVYVIEHWK